MLNRRHKVILFVTLVTTGAALLAGAKLTEGLGICILGVAFAWVFGSETISRTFDSVRRVSGKTWPWLKVQLFMALGGCLLVVVAIWSNFNSFLVAAALSIFGMLGSPLRQLPTQRRWLKYIVWTVGAGVFFFAAVGVSLLSTTAEQNEERIGELTVYALIALVIGMLWLAKGWKLFLSGINFEQGAESVPPLDDDDSNPKGTIWLHVSLFIGTIVLTLWLGLLAFSAFSDSTFPDEIKTASSYKNPLLPALFLMLLARWPYASWRSILEREPNRTLKNVRRHKFVTAMLGGVFTIVLCVAMVFGIQNGNDRISSAKVEEGAKGFQDMANKIGAIKGRDLRTADDYIAAYEEIDPLLVEFDAKLQEFTDVLSLAQQREKTRGPLNIQRLYGTKSKEWLVWDTNTFQLLRQDSELTRKQIQVVRQMGQLPAEYRVEFWKKNFRPLQQEEDVLRQQLVAAKQSIPK